MKTYIFKTPLLCNQSCFFCVTNASYSEKEYIYPVKKFSLYCIALKVKGYTHITIEGGEPTMILNLGELISIANKSNLKVSIISNGYNIKKTYLEELYINGLRNITFSIHSSKEDIHDQLVQKKGSFQYLKESIKMARELGFYISSNSVICYQNQNDLYEIVLLCNSLSMKEISFCCLEINKAMKKEYLKKKFLFPEYEIIRNEIKKIKQTNVKIDNLPLCIFDNNNFYTSARYKDIRLSNRNNINERKKRSEKTKLKTLECKKCKYDNYCDGVLTYFDTSKLRAYEK